MIDKQRILVIIPALNEEESIKKVISEIPEFADEIVVVDNGSIDNTTLKAWEAGAIVIKEFNRGYGAACLKGIEYADTNNFDIIVFIDADYSDYPGEMNLLLEPILKYNYELVIGSRMITRKKHKALLPQAILGNWIASLLIKFLWEYKYTDLGPFRAIKYSSLKRLNMKDKNYGWTVEMQIKAAKQNLRIMEIPVNYRSRIGRSKISGSLGGAIKASVKILFIIFSSLSKDKKYVLKENRNSLESL
jgi:glycosyltransferase involved in cell wall biosynthesis